ncbi:MAG: hypothetical protein WCR29_06110 [Bacteroidales bacterium]
MKKTFLFIMVIGCLSLVSCTQTDCTCVATQQKSTTSGASSTYPVYDWGGSCSSISPTDIPDISNSGIEYNLNCSEL